jgi:hypothetical protein
VALRPRRILEGCIGRTLYAPSTGRLRLFVMARGPTLKRKGMSTCDIRSAAAVVAGLLGSGPVRY